jgi:chemotaxis protein methyltransferase CheR
MAILPDDFRFVAELVRAASGVVIEHGKEYLVEVRLQPVVSQSGFANLSGLVAALRSRPIGPLAQMVVDAMTTNETSFFRDVLPFEHLREHVLPELIERRAQRRQLSIWSAAASSGQEPYSIAMLLREHFPQIAGWNLRLLATDISQPVIARGREGLYNQLEVNRGLPATLLVRYFHRRGIQWQLDEDVRRLVHWREFNLAARRWPALEAFDVVLLRNVMIYFDPATKRQVLGNVRKLLAPDGSLFLGMSESAGHGDEAFVSDPLHSACFRPKAA